jgi:hypothetical protein
MGPAIELPVWFFDSLPGTRPNFPTFGLPCAGAPRPAPCDPTRAPAASGVHVYSAIGWIEQ